MTLLIISMLLVLSLNINAQVVLVIICNRIFKSQKLRDIVDQVNNQVYSLRGAIKTFIRDRHAVIRVFCSNMAKLVVWYALPFFILVQDYPDIDLWLTVALISFTVILGVFCQRLEELAVSNLSMYSYLGMLLERLMLFLHCCFTAMRLTYYHF